MEMNKISYSSACVGNNAEILASSRGQAIERCQ